MAAGFTYDLNPAPVIEEKYDVQTGIRRRGAYKLDATNLTIGEYLPSFVPISANLKTKLCVPVRNFVVFEAYADGATSLTLKVKKSPYPYVGMFIGNGSKGAQVSGVDKSNPKFDALTLAANVGANLSVGDVLFESKTSAGTTPKNIANSALYERKKIDNGINLIALLSAAREIEPDKLDIPFSSKDKESLGKDFQFNE